MMLRGRTGFPPAAALDHQLAGDDVPVAGAAQGGEVAALEIEHALVAAALGQCERSDREALLTQRIGRGREGVAAAKAGAAQVLVDLKCDPAIRDRLAVQRNRGPGGAERKGLVLLARRASSCCGSSRRYRLGLDP
jgi:hypothetical protein